MYLEGRWNISVSELPANGIERKSRSTFYSLEIRQNDDKNFNGTLQKYLNQNIDDEYLIQFIQSYNSENFFSYNVVVSKKNIEKTRFDLNFTIDYDDLIINSGEIFQTLYSVNIAQSNFVEITTFQKNTQKAMIYRLIKQKQKKFGLRYLFPDYTIFITILWNILRLLFQ